MTNTCVCIYACTYVCVCKRERERWAGKCLAPDSAFGKGWQMSLNSELEKDLALMSQYEPSLVHTCWIALRWARYCAKSFRYSPLFKYHVNPFEVDVLLSITPILQMRKLRPTASKQLAQGHRAGPWQIWDGYPGCPGSEFVLCTSTLYCCHSENSCYKFQLSLKV